MWVKGDGNTTMIGHDSSGAPTNIMGPFGQTTMLATDASGYLSAIVDPANALTVATYSEGGLMKLFKTGRGFTRSLSYDSLGRLSTDTDAANATIGLSSAGDHNYWATDLASG